MRRLASILALVASLSLLAAPFGFVHAHIGAAHIETVVHSGHSHDFDDHAAQSHSGDDHSDDSAPDLALLLLSVSTTHVMQIDYGVSDVANNHQGPIITAPRAELFAPARSLSYLERPPPLYARPIVRRAYLQPPLRGPPRTTP
jgi:hypothetical protein